MDTIYGNTKILIPTDLPDILKQFTKSAIRTQPKDILQWAAAYFRALANGTAPPVKERIEFISTDKDTWITLGLLRVLHRQFTGVGARATTRGFSISWQPAAEKLSSLDRPPVRPYRGTKWVPDPAMGRKRLEGKEYVSAIQIKNNWDGLCLDPKKFTEIIHLGNFSNRIIWYTFLATVCCVATSRIIDALRLFCEVVTTEPEGYPARVKCPVVAQAFKTITEMKGNVDQTTINEFIEYLTECADVQNDYVHPGNFLSPSCPLLN